MAGYFHAGRLKPVHQRTDPNAPTSLHTSAYRWQYPWCSVMFDFGVVDEATSPVACVQSQGLIASSATASLTLRADKN